MLVIAQVFGGAGLAAGVIVGAIFAKDILGPPAVLGFPPRCSGSAAAALTVGRLSHRYGRRVGLTVG